MVHLNKTIYALLLAVIILSGCSQREEEDKGGLVDNSQSEMAYVQFVLQANGSAISITRSPSEGTPEDSYSHVQGTEAEYKVNTADVYLFDSASKLFVKSVELKGLTRTGTDASGNIIYEAERVPVPQGTYDIFVVANNHNHRAVMNTENEDKFLADLDDITYAKGVIEDISSGVEMTNRATDNLGVVIMKRQDQQDNVVNIYVERVLARLDVAKSAESYSMTNEKMEKYAEVSLQGYYVVNLPRKFYTFRHTAVLTNLTEPQWKLPDNFGKVENMNGYVIDPYFFKKPINAEGFTDPENYYEHSLCSYYKDAVTWTSFNPAAAEPQYKTMYCLENCTLAPASKNGYSTGVIFKAKFEPYRSVYHLNVSGELELVTDPTKYPEKLYYFNYKFYDSPEALAKAVGATPGSQINLDKYNAREYVKTDEGYMSYYNYWIRHYDNNKPTEMGVMEFAIVRNNLYRMMITNIKDLGPGEPTIDVDIPDEGDTFLKVVLNVKPWIVRDQTDIEL